MNRAIAWFAQNPVAANLLAAMIIAGGLTAVFQLPQKTFPDIDTEMIRITVEYLGAAPEEIEEGVCIRIEEEIEGIDGIDKIRSSALRRGLRGDRRAAERRRRRARSSTTSRPASTPSTPSPTRPRSRSSRR